VRSGLGPSLAKRFGAESRLDDRTFVVAGNASASGGIDYTATKPTASDEVIELFSVVDHDKVTASWRSGGHGRGPRRGKLGR